MGADATLVNAAFREAKSKAMSDVIDMSPLHQSTMAISNRNLLMLTNTLKEFKAEKEKARQAKSRRANKVAEKGDKLWEKLYEQEETLPNKFVVAIEDELERLQEELETVNTVGGGDTKENRRARARINGEVERVRNQAVNARKNLQIIANNVKKQGSLLERGISDDVLAASDVMLDFDNYDSLPNVDVKFINAKLTLTASNYYSDATSSWGDAISMTPQELSEALKVKDVTFDTDYLKTNEKFFDIGKQDYVDGNGMSFNKDREKGRFESNIQTEKDFSNAALRPVDAINQPSFVDALEDNLGISVALLDEMFYDDNGERVNIGNVFSELDKQGNKDGIIDIKDSMNLSGEALESFKRNHKAMIDALVNVNNPAFDINISKKLLSEYYVSFHEQAYEQGYEAKRLSALGKDKTGSTVLGGQWKEYAEQDYILDQARKGNVSIQDWDGNTWFPIGDGTYTNNQKGEKEIILPIGELLRGRYFGLSYRMGTKYPGVWPDTQMNFKTPPAIIEKEDDKITSVEDEEVENVRLPFDIASTPVKKINGVWHIQVGILGNKTWKKATKKQIKKINKQYK